MRRRQSALIQCQGIHCAFKSVFGLRCARSSNDSVQRAACGSDLGEHGGAIGHPRFSLAICHLHLSSATWRCGFAMRVHEENSLLMVIT